MTNGDKIASDVAESVADLISDSRDTHGDAIVNHQHIADGWNWYLQAQGHDVEIEAGDVARMMILLKLSRSVVGEYDFDHDRDMVGYASIAGASEIVLGDVDDDVLTDE